MAPDLSAKCVAGAISGFNYFLNHEEIYRDQAYFSCGGICSDCGNEPCRCKCGKDFCPCVGRDGMAVSALAELYMTTGDDAYLKMLEGMQARIKKMTMTWPEPLVTDQPGFWFSAPFMARLAGKISDSGLKEVLISASGRAARGILERIKRQPWPFDRWSFHGWGNNRQNLGRIFDVYYLEKVAPHLIGMADTIPSALWLFGLHPLNDYTFVTGTGLPGPRYLYNGQLIHRFGAKPQSVPGAVVPGITALEEDTGILLYRDEPYRFAHNEACIYTAASYVFAMNALTRAGF